MLAAIRQWVIKTMTKGQTGVVTTMPKPQLIEMNVQITAERLMRNGINPEDLKTVGQVENVINQIDTPKVNVNPGVTKVKEADVMDMEGNKIDTSKGIMGGKQIQPINMTVEERTGGLLKGKYESDEAIKARIEAGNEKGIASMKNKLDDPEEKADGGRIGLLAGSVPKLLKLLKNKKKVQAAVDDIFPTGDYKYDAQMAADALVENNPKIFGNRLYDDLDQDTQMEIYSTVLEPITNKMATQMKLQRATRPEKTLASMNEGKGIDMSDPEIADEFGRFMKETDPKGYKELEQKVELSNFKTKDRKGNADGGRIGYFMGSAYPKGAAALREMLKLFGKKSDSVKNPSDILKIVNPKQFNKMLEDPRIYGKFDVEKGIGAPDMIKNLQKKMTSDRQSTVKEMLDAAKNIKTADNNTIRYKNKMIEDMMNKGVDRKMAEEMAETISRMAEDATGKFNTPKLSDEGILQLENILKNMETGGKKPRDLNADGGRIGLKGGMNKRTFLKLMGSVGASIGAAKSGLFSFGKGAGKTVAKEVAQQTTSSMPPPYFFKLAEKIKKLGKDTTPTNDRTIAKSLKSKDGTADYVLEEDMVTGDVQIKKINMENDNMINDIEIMEYRTGENVMTKDGKVVTTPHEYDEVTESYSRIYKDDYNAPDYQDGIRVDEIIKEVDDTTPSIKYATGGRVPYFKGGLAVLKTLMNFFAKEKGTTGSKLLSDINPKKIDSGIKNLMSKEELNQLKENRTEYVKHLLNIIKSDKNFLDNNRAIVEETIAQAPIGMEDIAKEISDSIKRNAMKENRLERLSVYDKVNPDDAIMDVEMMIKNMSTGKKDKRALNASGGLAYMLGE